MVIRGLCVVIDMAWCLLALLLIWRWHELYARQPSALPVYHVTISGGDIVYWDYWTTCSPPPFHADVPWYECLKFTNEN
jgi:hypothetical protein